MIIGLEVPPLTEGILLEGEQWKWRGSSGSGVGPPPHLSGWVLGVQSYTVLIHKNVPP